MKRSWSQELVATAELVGVEIRYMSNPIHMVRAIREGLEALLLQRAQEIEQVKAENEQLKMVLRTGTVVKTPAVGQMPTEAALVSRAPQPEQEP